MPMASRRLPRCLQDALFGVECYVGGPSEMAYLRQVAPLYQALDVRASRPVRRSSVRLIEPDVAQSLHELGLRADALVELDEHALDRLLAARASGVAPDALERELLDGFERRLARLEAEQPELSAEPALHKGLSKTRESVRRSVGKLVARYARALARRDPAGRAQLEQARASLTPGGTPQERVLSLPYYLARYGAAHVVTRVIEAIEDPEAGATLDVSL